jgi:hypothetical protein
MTHSLQPKKLWGYDDITSKILKAGASLISHPLSYIYNHLLYTGLFTDHLKLAAVKPLYKKVFLFSIRCNQILICCVYSTCGQRLAYDILCSVSLLFSCRSTLARCNKIFFYWGQNLLLAALAVVPWMGDDDDDLPTHKDDSSTIYTIQQYMCCKWHAFL